MKKKLYQAKKTNLYAQKTLLLTLIKETTLSEVEITILMKSKYQKDKHFQALQTLQFFLLLKFSISLLSPSIFYLKLKNSKLR